MQLPISKLLYQLPFDSHNHIQLGDWISSSSGIRIMNDKVVVDAQQLQLRCRCHDKIMDDIRIAVPNCCGMALMSTHPRDFDIIQFISSSLEGTLNHTSIKLPPVFYCVPSFGVHPWFVHELTNDDWQPQGMNETLNDTQLLTVNDHLSNAITTTTTTTTTNQTSFLSKYYQEYGRPQWIQLMETYIRENPKAIIGEIGLDKFHYTTTTIIQDHTTTTTTTSNNDHNDTTTTTTITITKLPKQKQLTTPIEQQIRVFRLQMELAIQYQRPVCIHCVQAFGPLLDTMANIKLQYNQRYKSNISNNNSKNNNAKNHTFPINKIYFHAYGGKLNTVLQILSMCEGMNHNKKSNIYPHNTTSVPTTTTTTKCYFGFAPCVNFRAPKTADIIRSIGLSRLLLETDLEDLSLVSSSLQEGIQYIANVLNIDTTTVIEQTTKNAMEFYNLSEYESNLHV